MNSWALTSCGVVVQYYYSLTYINTRVHTSPTLLPRVLGALYRVLGLTNPTLGALYRVLGSLYRVLSDRKLDWAPYTVS